MKQLGKPHGKKLQGPMVINLKKDDILCASGEKKRSLYLIYTGKLLAFVTKGFKVTPIAYLEAGEYVGELSFFDTMPRSAHVVAVEECSLIQIPANNLTSALPSWLLIIARSITKRIRDADEIIRQKGIRKQNTKSIQALSIDAQRHYYKLIKDYTDKHKIPL